MAPCPQAAIVNLVLCREAQDTRRRAVCVKFDVVGVGAQYGGSDAEDSRHASTQRASLGAAVPAPKSVNRTFGSRECQEFYLSRRARRLRNCGLIPLCANVVPAPPTSHELQLCTCASAKVDCANRVKLHLFRRVLCKPSQGSSRAAPYL